MRATLLLTVILGLAFATAIAGADGLSTSGLRIDGGLRAYADHGELGRPVHARKAAVPGSNLDAGRIPCLVRGTVSRAALAAMGIRAGSEAGGVIGADLTWDEVARVSALPGVQSISLAHRARPWLDISRVEIGANLVQGGTPPNYTGVTGKGVVVGFVDTGIDWNHADFKDKNGVNRIRFLWDQNASAGTGGPAPTTFGYGVEWDNAGIQAGHCTEVDDAASGGHGTHVTGIAAGSGRATGNGKPNYKYVGIAPESDIIMVATDFTFNHILDGVQYVFEKADSLGEAAVVNLSLGSNYGPHDGTDPQDIAINAMSGPGHVVCVAAGNSGSDSMHAEITLAQGDSAKTTMVVPVYTPNNPGTLDDYFVIDAYYKVGDSVSVKITSPGGWTSSLVPIGSTYSGDATGSQGHVYIDNGSQANQTQPLPNGEYNLFIQVYDKTAAAPPAAGVWTLTVKGVKIHSGGHMDQWMADTWLGVNGDIAGFRQSFTPVREISTPSTAESTICVAAYATKLSWKSPGGTTFGYTSPFVNHQLAPFSAHGPTADGRQRPTISAPGLGVASSRPSYIAEAEYTVEDSAHFMDQGTSMACPHASGVTALIFQNHPHVGPAAVKAAMIATARTDGFTGAVWNNAYGWGKLSAQADTSRTPYEISTLDGEETSEGYTLSWFASTEAGFTGFGVSRAASATGPWTPLTQQPLPAATRTYVDHPGVGTWFYKVEALRLGGSVTIGPLRAVVTGAPATALRLDVPRPNPCLGRTQFSFVIPGTRSADVDLAVFDATGRRVATLNRGLTLPGRHDVSWLASSPGGSPLASGLYFVRLRTPYGDRTQKLALLR